MTEYSKQVAELVEDAFKGLKDGAKTSPAAPADLARDYAMAQLAAAQVVATLGLANEVRAVGLLLASAGHAAAEPSAELARFAFTSAAVHLGLVDEEPDPSREDFLANLYAPGTDPADKDVEL